MDIGRTNLTKNQFGSTKLKVEGNEKKFVPRMVEQTFFDI